VTPPGTYTWTIHLAARRPGRAVLLLIIIGLALFGVAALLPAAWTLPGRLMLLALSALLLIGSIAEFLLPVTYTLDGDGAHARHLGSHRVLPWHRVRRVYLRPDGIHLSPLSTRSWAASYRGVTLRTPDRDAVLAQVRAWTDHAGVTPEISEEP